MTSSMTPLTKDDLINYLQQGCKSRTDFKVGVEHEQFIFQRDTWQRAPYAQGIERLLTGFEAQGWTPIHEKEHLIAVQKAGAAITLEPGGQFELSGAPYASLHECTTELNDYFYQLDTLLKPLGLGRVGLGYDPLTSLKEATWMPKGRYTLMRDYMPQQGTRGLEMMTHTCTVQANLDFASEADMVRKFRVALALQPLATALFAQSPLAQGSLNDYQSFRRYIWQRTDPQRCGLLSFVFDSGMGFERYVEYVLDVPMYFIKRQGQYLDATGQSFRHFLKAPLEKHPEHHATLVDWEDHLTTVFTEVRLKKYLEMRGADSGDQAHINALAALWTGLLYDDIALGQAEELIQTWTMEEMTALYNNVAQQGLQTRIGSHSLQDIALNVVRWAHNGLVRRGFRNTQGQDESIYLEYLDNIITTQQTPANRLREKFQQNPSIDSLLADLVLPKD